MAQGGGGGYDISQSTSESATQGLSQTLRDFNVGGGLKIPEWVWYVAAGIALLFAWRAFKR